MQHFIQRLKAFTLAEVLITLGIIGIIAAITIPALIQNTQNLEYKSALKKDYAVLSQAIEQLKYENGGNLANLVTFGYRNALMIRLKPYLSYIKSCNATSAGTSDLFTTEAGCWHTNIADTKRLNNTPAVSIASDIYPLGSNDGGVILNDGAFLITCYQHTACGMSTGLYNNYCGYALLDVNGLKAPNTQGRDIFAFRILIDRIIPWGAPGDTATMQNNYTSDCTTIGNGCAYEYLVGNK